VRGSVHGGRILLRRWPVVIAVLGLMIPVLFQAAEAKGVYWTRVNVVFLPPPGAAGGNPLRSDSQDLVQYAAVIERLALEETSDPPMVTNGASLYGTGIRNGYSVYLPNTGTQWQPSFPRAVVAIEVVAEDAASVSRLAEELAAKLDVASTRQQDALGVVRAAHITTELSPAAPDVTYHAARPASAVAALSFLALGLATAAAMLAEAAERAVRNRKPLKLR
jgi:hypothetical protein